MLLKFLVYENYFQNETIKTDISIGNKTVAITLGQTIKINKRKINKYETSDLCKKLHGEIQE